jgi:Domain of unknown function (DUF4349)
MRHFLGCILVLSFLALFGCSRDDLGSRLVDTVASRSAAPEDKVAGSSSYGVSEVSDMPLGEMARGVPPAQLGVIGGGGEQREQGAPEKEVSRKIVYTATMKLVVEDLDKADQKLHDAIKSFNGYVTQSDVGSASGSPRTGRWTARIPVGRFDEFRAAVRSLGELVNSGTDSKDVTDEFYDRKKRIGNLQAEEESLRKLYDKASGKLEDVLMVRRELARVRDEIDRQQGRLQLLEKLSAMTTVTVEMYERRGYVPAESPGFGVTVGRTWGASLDALATFGKGCVLVVVALAPWLPLIFVVSIPLFLLYRRHRLSPAFVRAALPSGTPSSNHPNPSPPA